MKVFNIYRNDSGDYKAVKNGWSWPGFFFQWIWLLSNGLWLITILYFILIFSFFSLIKSNYIECLRDILAVLTPTIFGAFGNIWKANNLLEKNYSFKGIVTASDLTNAINIYISENESDKL